MAFYCAIPIVKSLFAACSVAGPLAVGYVEGEYALIAPVETALIDSLAVARGDRFEAGQPLVQLETRDVQISVREAEAALAVAQSQYADLLSGKRQEEIAVLEAGISSANSQLDEVRRTLRRQADLLKNGTTTQSAYDSAATSFATAKARVAEANANLAVARLPARPAQIKAARARIEQSQAILDHTQWRLRQRTLSSPASGVVFDVTRNPGELAGPQAPVLSVLPDGAVKLRVFVAQAALAKLSIGTQLRVHCDGCGEAMTASVSYIAADPQFTPPVIYSLQNRQKLVYLIEARPGADALALKPGQLIDVSLPSAKP